MTLRASSTYCATGSTWPVDLFLNEEIQIDFSRRQGGQKHGFITETKDCSEIVDSNFYTSNTQFSAS